jgi:bifunctional ADP-heptose synthase (sugar kinase/adenylyltransferase)
VDRRRLGRGTGEIAIQCTIDLLLPVAEILLESHAGRTLAPNVFHWQPQKGAYHARGGAGDYFSAWLAVGLAEGLPLIDSGELAVRATAVAVTRPGAQPGIPRRDEVPTSAGAKADSASQ